MGIGKEIGSAALGGLTGGVGGLVSGAIGGLGSLMGIGRRKEKKLEKPKKENINGNLSIWAYKRNITKSRRNTLQSYQKQCGTIPTTKIKKNIWKQRD